MFFFRSVVDIVYDVLIWVNEKSVLLWQKGSMKYILESGFCDFTQMYPDWL